jgi:hypothetical protein
VGRRPHVRFLFGLVAGMALVFAASANAYTIAQSGRPGKVGPKGIVGYSYSDAAPYVAWPGGTIGRSPAAPDRLQIICARYSIFDWNYTYGTWDLYDTSPQGRQNCTTVLRSQHLNMAPIIHSGTTSFGRVRGVWTISWYANLPTYRRIGSLVLDFRDEGDYSCATAGCNVSYNSASDRYYLTFPG